MIAAATLATCDVADQFHHWTVTNNGSQMGGPERGLRTTDRRRTTVRLRTPHGRRRTGPAIPRLPADSPTELP